MTIPLRALRRDCRGRTAIVHRDVDMTGAALDAAAERVAAALAHSGVDASHRVALVLGNTPSFAIALLAVMKLRASALLLGPRFTPREIAQAVGRAGAGTILADASDASQIDRSGEGAFVRARDAVDRASLGLWLTPHGGARAIAGELTVQLTSGVSGASRLVPRTIANIAEELESFATHVNLTRDDPTVCPVPVFHAYGLINGVLLPLYSGRPSILIDWFLPSEVIQTVHQHRARVLVAVPAMYRWMADTDGATADQVSSLRIAFSAGAPLPAAVAAAFGDRFGVTIRQQYGSTETGVIAVNLDDGAATGSVGRPVIGRRVDIVSDAGAPLGVDRLGEIVVESPTTAAGYVDDVAASAERFHDGRYYSGDLGRLTRDGDVVLTGRRTAFINVAGNKVDPTEIEGVLARCDAVAECAVVPMPDRAAGQVVKAVVVPRRKTSALEIRRFCRAHLAAHKVPRVVSLLDALPRTASGKVLAKHLIDA